MATLEDKILNEKLEYYCSSSSEDEGKDSEASDSEETKPESVNSGEAPSVSCNEWNGTSSNTGPKGVLRVNFIFLK